jgi:DNA-binding transcriptional regulator GbsR (MarR family)
MTLSPTEQQFVLHWGEMGTRWGVNRTVAQIHALLFLSDRPLNAEELADTLDVARSNVSTSLKELQSWGLVRITHVMNDRRDHFSAHQDVWDIFRAIMEERKKRELDPTLTVLRDCVIEAERDKELPVAARKKMTAVLDFVELVTQAHDDFQHLPTPTLKRLLKMGGKVARFVGQEPKADRS